MGIQSISNDELVGGAIDFFSGCVKNRVGPMQQLDISNGEKTAGLDAMFYKSNPELYWRIKTDRLRLIHVDSELFVSGYNIRAERLGIPTYHITIDDLVSRLIVFMLFLKILKC